MFKNGRPGMSAEQMSLMWRMWRSGYFVRELCDALGRQQSSVSRQLALCGGISPQPRRRAEVSLSATEREEISRGLGSGESLRAIARRLQRAPSTISREVARHRGRRRYRANKADFDAWQAALRPKACKLALNSRLRAAVAGRLALNWSPEQICGWLKLQFPDDESMRVSHETIYRTLFIQARGALKKELVQHLRTRRMYRQAKRRVSTDKQRGVIPGMVPISERPAEAADRAIPGHWEGDLLFGTRTSQIITLVERHSRFTSLIKVQDRTTESVTAALTRHVRKLPAHLRRTVTWDRGKEMAAHADFAVATDVQVYFCDPSSPWQRGSNENTNGLLRQYFPKGIDLSDVTQAQLDKVALQLNQRPRKTLGFQTPADKFRACVAATG